MLWPLPPDLSLRNPVIPVSFPLLLIHLIQNQSFRYYKGKRSDSPKPSGMDKGFFAIKEKGLTKR